MMKFLKLLDMYSCNDVSQLVSDAQERALSLVERFGLYAHLLICKSCDNYNKHIKFLRKAIMTARDNASMEPDTGMSDSARDRIRQQLTQKTSS